LSSKKPIKKTNNNKINRFKNSFLFIDTNSKKIFSVKKKSNNNNNKIGNKKIIQPNSGVGII